MGTLLHGGGGRTVCELFLPLACPSVAQRISVAVRLELHSYGGGPPLMVGKSGKRFVRCTYARVAKVCQEGIDSRCLS